MNNFMDRLAKATFTSQERITFYEDMALLLDNGVSLLDTLKELYAVASNDGRKPNAPRAIILRDAIRAVASGHSFADAMTRWVTVQESALIAAGEASGKLLESFKRIAMLLQKRSAMVGAISKALGYPALLIAGAFAMFTFVGFGIAPMLIRLMPADRWHGPTHRMLVIGLFMKANIVLIAVALVVLVLALAYSLPRLRGRLRDTLDHIPPFSIYRLFQGSAFLLNIATMLASGVALEDALVRMARHASPYLKERIDHTLRGIRSGKTLGDALKLAEHDFPDRETIGSLRVISGRAGFDVALERYTLRWLDKNLRSVETAATLLRVIAFILVALAVLTFVTGIYGIQNSAGKAF